MMIAIAYLRERNAENRDASVMTRHRTTITKEREGRKRGRKSSLVRKQVRDKIASNELFEPDMSLMRTAEIISGRDRNARAHRGSARYTRLRCSLATRSCFQRLEKLEDFSPVIPLSFLNAVSRREGYDRLCFYANSGCTCPASHILFNIVCECDLDFLSR